MEQILSCSSHIPAVTSISNIFIEKYMLNANGSYVKVYLYFSKCIQAGENDISVESAADKLESTEKDILRALQYWEKKHLIVLSHNEYGVLTGMEFVNPNEIEPQSKTTINVTEDVTITNEAEYHQKPIEENENFIWTCHVVEKYLNRPLKSGEMQLLIYLYGKLEFSSDLILYLYEYCISLDKTNINYIQTVALSWDEKKIKTPEDAQLITANYNTVYNSVSKAFGLGRQLVTVEKKMVDRWQNNLKMDLSVILEACNRTILKIQKADFNYADGILKNWYEYHIHTLQDIETYDNIHAKKQAESAKPKAPVFSNINNSNNTMRKNQFQSFQQRSVTPFEMSELEKKLLNR